MLTEYLNIAFGTLFIPAIKLDVLIGLVISSFAVIRLRDELDALSSFLMHAILISTVVLIIPITMVLSSTYQISQQFNQALYPTRERITDRRTRDYFERQLKSCMLIRCKVGNMYYMEARAKLTMVDHTVNGLVCLLVNTKA